MNNTMLTVTCGIVAIIAVSSTTVSRGDAISQTESTELTESVQTIPVESLGLASVDQLQSTAQTLLVHKQAQRGFFSGVGSLLAGYTDLTAAFSTTLILALLGKQFSEAVDLEGPRLFFAGSGLCYGMYATFNRIVEWLGRSLENNATHNTRALELFLKEWAVNKENTPAFLHPLFDDLARDIEAHNQITHIAPDQISLIVEDIIATADLGQQMTEALSLHFKRSEDDDYQLNSIVPLFLAVRISVNQDLHGCTIVCNDSHDQKAYKDRWHNVARQLGILKQSTWLNTLGTFFDTYLWPLTFGIGLPAGFVGGVKAARYLTGGRDYLSQGRLYGSAAGFALVSVFCKLLSRLGNETHWRREHLNKFIMNWKGQKHNTPPCLHGLFDQLYRLYIKNHRALNLDNLFIDELYQIILEAWLYAALPAGQQQPKPETSVINGTGMEGMVVNSTVNAE